MSECQKCTEDCSPLIVMKGEKAGNYSMYRDRLLKRGILESRRAFISFTLPYFADYINEYCL